MYYHHHTLYICFVHHHSRIICIHSAGYTIRCINLHHMILAAPCNGEVRGAWRIHMDERVIMSSSPTSTSNCICYIVCVCCWCVGRMAYVRAPIQRRCLNLSSLRDTENNIRKKSHLWLYSTHQPIRVDHLCIHGGPCAQTDDCGSAPYIYTYIWCVDKGRCCWIRPHAEVRDGSELAGSSRLSAHFFVWHVSLFTCLLCVCVCVYICFFRSSFFTVHMSSIIQGCTNNNNINRTMKIEQMNAANEAPHRYQTNKRFPRWTHALWGPKAKTLCKSSNSVVMTYTIYTLCSYIHIYIYGYMHYLIRTHMLNCVQDHLALGIWTIIMRIWWAGLLSSGSAWISYVHL